MPWAISTRCERCSTPTKVPGLVRAPTRQNLPAPLPTSSTRVSAEAHKHLGGAARDAHGRPVARREARGCARGRSRRSACRRRSAARAPRRRCDPAAPRWGSRSASAAAARWARHRRSTRAGATPGAGAGRRQTRAIDLSSTPRRAHCGIRTMRSSVPCDTLDRMGVGELVLRALDRLWPTPRGPGVVDVRATPSTRALPAPRRGGRSASQSRWASAATPPQW